MTHKRKKDAKTTIDPELKRQLDIASEDIPIEAVFTLTTPPGESYRSNDSTNQAVSQIVDEAASASKSTPKRVKVFPNAQSFAVSGSAALVRSLLEHQDIASAIANVQQEDMLIRPVPSEASQKKESSRRRSRKRDAD